MKKEKIEQLLERLETVTNITDSTEYADEIVNELLKNAPHCVYDLLFSTEKLALSPIDFIEYVLTDEDDYSDVRIQNYDFINEYLGRIEDTINAVTQKYELRVATTEIKYKDAKKSIVEGVTVFGGGDVFDTLVDVFDTKEEALQELSKYKTQIDEFSTCCGYYYYITEYFVQEIECDYDDNAEFVEYVEFSKLEIVVEDDDGNEHIFNNYKEAREFYDEQENGYCRLF